MRFHSDSERQLYLRYRGNIRLEYMKTHEIQQVQTAENLYGKQISRDAKEQIKIKREKEKVDMVALLRGI